MTTLDLPGTAQTAAQPVENPDEALRRLAGKRLAEYLNIGVGLATECSRLASGKSRDHLGPITAAARLFNSNARVAQALALVALVERRQRTIIERIQPPKPDAAELNSRNAEKARSDLEAFQVLEQQFLDSLVEERRERLKAPTDPQEEANLMLEEELWLESQHDKTRR